MSEGMTSAIERAKQTNGETVVCPLLSPNIGTMIPAAAISIPASMNNPSFSWILHNKPRTPDKDKKP